MAETARPLVIDDVRAWPGWNALPKLNWVRSYVGAPIITKQAVIGFIGLMSSQLSYFTRQHAEQLQAFAQQAAIAIDNVRLFQAERAQSDLAEALRDTAAALNSTLNLDEVLDRILANASRVVPYDAINIMLIDGPRATARVVRQLGYAERGIDSQITQITVPLASVFGFRYMADTGRIYVVPDTRRAPDWVSFPATAWIRSYIGVPFQIDGQVGGFLNLDSATPEFFTHEHAARLRAFADHGTLEVRRQAAGIDVGFLALEIDLFQLLASSHFPQPGSGVVGRLPGARQAPQASAVRREQHLPRKTCMGAEDTVNAVLFQVPQRQRSACISQDGKLAVGRQIRTGDCWLLRVCEQSFLAGHVPDSCRPPGVTDDHALTIGGEAKTVDAR